MPTEDDLHFWREYPELSKHHDHWHSVYPYKFPREQKGLTRKDETEHDPLPEGAQYFDPTFKPDPGDRRGELFTYMHQQMLARYDAERLSVGLPRVEPFDDYWAPIEEGYHPGELARWTKNFGWRVLDARPPGASISDIEDGEFSERPGASLRAQERFYDSLLAATLNVNGHYLVESKLTRVDIDNLGDAVEASENSVDYYGENNSNNYKTYGALHNDGHIHFGLIGESRNPEYEPFGIMFDEATAMRDPIFYRWHKHIDSIFRAWQDAQSQHDFSNGPRVKIRKGASTNSTAASPDIILCHKDGLPAEFIGDKLGSEAFGHSDDPGRNKWDHDFASSTATLASGETITTTDELLTEMRKRKIYPKDRYGRGIEEDIWHLSHDDFFYFIRVQNLSDQPQSVTVRIFLAPETEIEDRCSWIEMDRFLYQLGSSKHAVIFRPADLSSVVRKPALKPEDFAADDRPSPKSDQQPWCDCGWPYTLLLPQGTNEGMEFRLFVMLSSGDDLMLPPEHSEHCTSVSYCGLKDKKYPDKQEMGYPFNRRFRGSISSTVENYDNMAWRTITIRCKNV